MTFLNENISPSLQNSRIPMAIPIEQPVNPLMIATKIMPIK
jgi:hypothetical protein